MMTNSIRERRLCAIYPDRKVLRKRSKIAKWDRQKKEGMPGRKNEFGHLDLTPYNAGLSMSSKISNIKYK